MLTGAAEDKFVRTNWLVRQSILVCFKSLLELRMTGENNALTVEFGASLVHKAAEYGEKYDQNLVYLSAICLLVSEQIATLSSDESRSTFRESANKLITILKDKSTEVLIQNVDLIKRYISAPTGDVEMSQDYVDPSDSAAQ